MGQVWDPVPCALRPQVCPTVCVRAAVGGVLVGLMPQHRD